MVNCFETEELWEMIWYVEDNEKLEEYEENEKLEEYEKDERLEKVEEESSCIYMADGGMWGGTISLY